MKAAVMHPCGPIFLAGSETETRRAEQQQSCLPLNVTHTALHFVSQRKRENGSLLVLFCFFFQLFSYPRGSAHSQPHLFQ